MSVHYVITFWTQISNIYIDKRNNADNEGHPNLRIFSLI